MPPATLPTTRASPYTYASLHEGACVRSNGRPLQQRALAGPLPPPLRAGLLCTSWCTTGQHRSNVRHWASLANHMPSIATHACRSTRIGPKVSPKRSIARRAQIAGASPQTGLSPACRRRRRGPLPNPCLSAP